MKYFSFVLLVAIILYTIFWAFYRNENRTSDPLKQTKKIENTNTSLVKTIEQKDKPTSKVPASDPNSPCPDGMVFVPGGETIVVYSGDRWGGTKKEKVTVEAFCIDKYEASQPDATKTSMGSWEETKPVPAAQSKAGVISWSSVTWDQAKKSCNKAGKRLPNLAEWQTAFSGYEGAAWPWGNEYKSNSCYMDLQTLVHNPSGGCCFEICKGDTCFEICDMAGSLSEWIDGYWDENCYGKTEILCAGGSISNHDSPNVHTEDPDHPGCWKFELFAQARYGLHHHGTNVALDDDGFRCVSKPFREK